MAADQITVGFGALQTAAGDLSRGTATANQRLDQLQSDIAPMVSTWEGGAQQAYLRVQQKWDTAQQDLTRALGDLQKAVAQSTDQYQAGESQNIGRFPG